MTNTGVQSAPPRPVRTGWGWLAAAVVARVYLLFVLALAVCAFLPMLAGLTGSVVQSGSMRPSIDPGDVVLAVHFSKDEKVPLGRVVLFPAPQGSTGAPDRLHRIVAIDPDGSLVTAGDANAQADSSPLDRADIIAIACVLVPFIGLPALWLAHGAVLPFALWLLFTMGALVVETTRVLAVPRRRHRIRPTRAQRLLGTPDPNKPDAPRTFLARTAGPAAVILAILLGGTVVAVSAFTPANAAFTARSTSVGNSWSAASAAPAAKLAFATSPSASTGGIAFSRQPVVALQTAAGAVTPAPGSISLEITTPAGATLACAQNPVVAQAGYATFAGCAVDKIGTYTLTARSGALTAAVSAPFVISRGPAVKLGFTRQPSTVAIANSSFAVQPQVSVQDAGGNTVTTSSAAVTLGLTVPGSATLVCSANPRTASSGVATFSGCRVNRTGTYTLTATSGALAFATSSNITISPGAASKLVFTTSPSNSASDTIFSTQPVVTVQDASGNLVTTSTAAVTLSVTGTPGGTTLSCAANPKNAVSGISSFTGCKINKKGTYSLTARSGTLTAGTSASFAIGGG